MILSKMNFPSLHSLLFPLRKLLCRIPLHFLVVDVGSGGNPYPRANVLLDRPSKSIHRHGKPLVDSKLLILSNSLVMPFRNNAFDFSVCSHVLEHCEDPADFLSELERTSKSGYIETPSPIREQLKPFPIHLLEVGMDSSGLLISFKQAPDGPFSLSSYYEFDSSHPLSLHLLRNPYLLVTRYFWDGHINVQYLNSPPSSSWIKSLESRSPHASFASSLNLSSKVRIRRLFQYFISRVYSLLPSVSIEFYMRNLVQCPKCFSQSFSKVSSSQYSCSSCSSVFIRRSNLAWEYQER